MILDKPIADLLESELDAIQRDKKDTWLSDCFDYLKPVYPALFDEIVKYIKHEKINIISAWSNQEPVFPCVIIEEGTMRNSFDETIGDSFSSEVISGDIALDKYQFITNIKGLKIIVATAHQYLTTYLWLAVQYLIAANKVTLQNCFGNEVGFYNISLEGDGKVYDFKAQNGLVGTSRVINVNADFVSQVGKRHRAIKVTTIKANLKTFSEDNNDSFYDDGEYV